MVHATCVLIVDDDPDVREALSFLLDDEGYRVSSAADGAAALKQLKREQPCLVLLDLMMPEMSGWEILRRMRADPALAQVPVCVVSAVYEEAPAEAFCALPKPLDVDKLLDIVQQRCGAHLRS